MLWKDMKTAVSDFRNNAVGLRKSDVNSTKVNHSLRYSTS